MAAAQVLFGGGVVAVSIFLDSLGGNHIGCVPSRHSEQANRRIFAHPKLPTFSTLYHGNYTILGNCFTPYIPSQQLPSSPGDE
ncbi:hypothetical protein F5883DRAFT_538173 [Diaporthe sp. PMI_573]|nr:hypothetical protein F5883DRAFT_538173 [Diaporthaceae sp. PMI_573]